MPFAITLRFDDVSASTIAAMWELLARLRLDDERSQLDYPAHITLAIYPDDTPSDRLATAIATAATNCGTYPVQLIALGFFPSPSAVLWAVPVVTARLLAIHASIQTLLADLEVEPHYAADAWVPHVTLSGSLLDPAAALGALLPPWKPIQGVIDRIELVRFRPVAVSQTVHLPG